MLYYTFLMKKLLNIRKLLSISLLIIFSSIFNDSLFALSTDWVINDKSKVRLISSKTSSDNMESLILGLEYQLEPGWKTYWKSPGGGGFPQMIEWNNSTNINELKIDWPTPKEFEILGLTSLGYEDKVIFPLRINLKNKNVLTEINLQINYLVCKDICIPGNANLYLKILPGKGEYTDFFYDIEKTKSSLPIEDINLSPIFNLNTKAIINSNKVQIQIIAESHENFINNKIFIHTPFGLPVVQQTNKYSFNLKKIDSKFVFDADQFSKKNFPIEVLISDQNHNFNFIENISLEENSFEVNINKSILHILLISLLGGFILNLMPCVFPVLSIKLLSVLNTKSENIRLSFIYTAIGIITSFLLLALFFLILKQTQISIAWGMQFQDQYFLIFILLILTFFCLNTLGLFEIELPILIRQSKIFDKGSGFFTKNFFNGLFATLLATPCTAPFVGTAVTIAFTQTSFILFLVFLFMGLGMSIPYILVSIFPKTILILPKSGRWTVYTKYFLSILLIATIIWVLNILLNFFNEFFIVFFLITLFFLFIIYRFNYLKYTATIILIIGLFSIPSLSFFDQNKKIINDEKWVNFIDANIPELIKNNEIIFIDITADWCATCQFNKLNVLETKKIKNIFDQNNIVLVRADWTKPNKLIDDYLKKYNKFGIPFNAFFSSKYSEGIILSEILSEKEIINTLEIIK